jgi:RNA polymerase sigma-70 factor, ECF subfamily
VARGEHGAFDLLYEQLREPIQAQVRAVLRDPAQSEEVTQEVLLQLWRTAFRYPTPAQSGQWQLVTSPPVMVAVTAGLYSLRQIVYRPAGRLG